jgi:hypothetical protein
VPGAASLRSPQLHREHPRQIRCQLSRLIQATSIAQVAIRPHESHEPISCPEDAGDLAGRVAIERPDGPVVELHLSPEGVTEVRGGRHYTLPWTAVKDVRHFTRGGEQWVLSTHRGHRPLTVRTDGLTRAEAARLRELIPVLHAAARAAAEPDPR